MAYTIGRQTTAGMGKESVYGTEVAASVWYPQQEFTIGDSKKTITDNSGVGTRDETLAVDVDYTLSQGNFNGVIYINQFGNVLTAAFGVPTTAAHPDATGVKVHTFIPGGAQPSYTLAGKDPNGSTRFAGAMLNELVINGTTGAYANFTSSWLGRKSTSTANTPSISSDLKRILPSAITIKYADDVASLTAASAKPFEQFSLTFNNNLDTRSSLGTVDPVFLSGVLNASLTLNKAYLDTEFKDLVFGIDKKAIQIAMTNPDEIGTGTPTTPSIVITIEPGYFAEWQKEGGLNDIKTEQITFQPVRNLSNGKTLSIAVTNTETSY